MTSHYRESLEAFNGLYFCEMEELIHQPKSRLAQIIRSTDSSFGRLTNKAAILPQAFR